MSNTKSKLDTSKIAHVSEEVLSEGQFLNISRYIYKDHTGAEKTWEVAGRIYSPKDGTSDCVATLPVLRRMLKYDCLVLVKQYRPALKKYTLEFPAGVVEPSETSEETAIRQLKQETGFSCDIVKYSSPLTALDPCLSKCTMKVVTLEINGDDIANHAPKQSAAEAEYIEVVHIPIHELLPRLNGLVSIPVLLDIGEYSEQGIMIHSGVYFFALGLAVGSKSSAYSQTANQY